MTERERQLMKERKVTRAADTEKRQRQQIDGLRGQIAAMKGKIERLHIRALSAEQRALRFINTQTDASRLDQSDKTLITELANGGMDWRVIAEKFETDALTVATVIEMEG